MFSIFFDGKTGRRQQILIDSSGHRKGFFELELDIGGYVDTRNAEGVNRMIFPFSSCSLSYSQGARYTSHEKYTMIWTSCRMTATHFFWKQGRKGWKRYAFLPHVLPKLPHAGSPRLLVNRFPVRQCGAGLRCDREDLRVCLRRWRGRLQDGRTDRATALVRRHGDSDRHGSGRARGPHHAAGGDRSRGHPRGRRPLNLSNLECSRRKRYSQGGLRIICELDLLHKSMYS